MVFCFFVFHPAYRFCILYWILPYGTASLRVTGGKETDEFVSNMLERGSAAVSVSASGTRKTELLHSIAEKTCTSF